MEVAEETVSARTYTRANRGKNPNAHWVLDDDEVSTSTSAKKRKMSPSKKRVNASSQAQDPHNDESANGDEDGEVRCSCGSRSSDPNDERPMAECEKCLTWQHVECMIGVNDERQLPQPYFCWLCQNAPESSSTENVPQPAPGQGLKSSTMPIKRELTGAPEKPLAQTASTVVPEVEKVRASVRSALQKTFLEDLIPLAVAAGRLQPDVDANSYSLQLSEEIEESIYKNLANKGSGTKDVGKDYRVQFRTLSFNLRDKKNQDLQLRVIAREIDPRIFATMTSEQMLSPDLQRLAEEVRLESIRDSTLRADETPRLRKTHKGEELVEGDPSGDSTILSSTAPDAPADFDYDRSEDEPALGTSAPKVDITHENTGDGGGSGSAGNAEVRYDRVQDGDFVYSPGSDGPQLSDGGGDDGPDVFDSMTTQESGEIVRGSSPDSKSQLLFERIAIWEGELTLGNSLVAQCHAFHIGEPSFQPTWWSACFDTSQSLRIGGRLDSTVAQNYLDLAAKVRILASFVLRPLNPSQSQRLKALYDDLSSRKKVGVLPAHAELVKDAYIVPVIPGPAGDMLLATLRLGPDMRASLEAGQSLDVACPLLLGVFILPEREALERAMVS